MYKILSLMLFFPSVTFGLLSAEVFPWAILFSAFYIKKISTPFYLILWLFYFSSFYVLFQNTLKLGMLETDLIRSISAYLNVLLLAQVILQLNSSHIKYLCNLSRSIFWVLIILGLFQTLGGDSFSGIIKFLVPRGEGSALTESNRGVSLLATEPARAGIELTLIYLIGRLTERKSRFTIYLDFFVILFQVFIVKSASSVAFSLGAFLILYFNFRLNLLTVLSSMLFSLLVWAFAYHILPHVGGRAGDLALYILNDKNSDILFYIANESGNRLLALYSFMKSGFLHPFGYGVGSWMYSSMASVLESGLDFSKFRFFDVVANGNLVPFRGPGIFSNLLLDFGIVGTLLISYLFKEMLIKYNKFSPLSKKALVIFLFKITLFGSPGNPIIFIFFLLVFCSSKNLQPLNVK